MSHHTSQTQTTIPVVGKIYIVNFAFKTDFLYLKKEFSIKENVTLNKGNLLLVLKVEISEHYIICIVLNGDATLKITFPKTFFKTASNPKQWISLI